ncbi:KpsF/GutQ family sugar-phosphate isomerase [Flectobacillus sp. DC10W]|uniref:KpsF/GutQ family sugar-phosphate isomerase n=1 Tax=Flectobacillus longus TaxID=2984207 RepID=A0ABT6YM70_9BACT|nr:KpsF/GutQ family sugar-phosphate isomerase [Flectobacillus longus]MDI9864666.1 KpsF/GutQ family sugar-phosphate isomerase [Flectobacillus longus]
MKLVKNIQSTAKKVLQEEAEAIQKIIDKIDSDFESCVNHLLNSRGRFVITGIGKSAIIAQKIVATLNSTGTPALFMHAADAIHGDLGMIQDGDTVMCISKSGDTPEIKVLVPLIKRTGVKLIAMVSNPQSYLGKNADFILHALAEREADLLNLAPTTSTTVALALGDALAVCLLECRGFSSTDFAKYHPGGALGKKLYLKVSDIYPNHELPIVQFDTSIKDAIVEISSKRLGATAVVNSDGTLAGIITDGDVRRMLNKYEVLTGLEAKDIMTSNPKTIEPDAYATEALQVMQEKNITSLVVLENQKPIGFVHLHDLLKEGLV